MALSARMGKLALAATMTMGIAALSGCENAKGKDPYGSANWYGGYDDRQGKREPEPAPVAAAPAPAPVATGNCQNYRPNVGAGMGVASLAFPSGDVRSSAVLVHQVRPNQVRAGANYDMEIHVTNITNSTLQNVVVDAESVDNLSMNSSTPAAGRSSGGSAQWVLGDMRSCETRVIKVSAKADRIGTSSNCLSVSYNNVLCSATQVVQPALQLAKTMTPAEGMVCDTYTATIEVKNTGSGPAESVVIKDNLPAGMTTSDGKTALEIPVGTLAAGQAATRTFQLKASKSGRFENQATASASGGLSASSGTVAVVAKQPSLAVSVKCPNRMFVGREATYEITVQNKGDGACNNTTLNASLPSGANFVRASDGASGASWNLGSIAVGASKTVSLTLRPNTMGANRITATANCTCASPVSADCSVELAGIPAILVECIDDNDPVEVGGQTTYTITVKNQGSAPGTGIKLAVELPSEEDYVSSSGATTGSVSNRVVTFAPLATLAPGASTRWTVTARANKAADARLRIKVTSDQFSVPIEETESTNLYQ